MQPEQNEPELDDRMSDETKKFVKNFLAQTKPTDVIKLDPQVATKLKEDQAEKLFFYFKMDHLDIEEMHVKSLTDDYQIPITKYTPKSGCNTSILTIFFHGGGYNINSRKTHHITIAKVTIVSSIYFYFLFLYHLI